MDRLDQYRAQLTASVADLWAARPEVLYGLGALIAVLLVAAGVWLLVRRRRRTPGAPHQRAEDVIRRPAYVDPVLLDDLLGHVEHRDFGRSLRATLDGDDLDGRPAETRKLNKVLIGLRSRPDLHHDLDGQPGTELETGKAIVVTGRFERMAATDVAELLELSTPVLAYKERRAHPSRNGDEPPGRLALAPRPTEAIAVAPLVLRLRPVSDRRDFLVVLDPEGLRVDDRELLVGEVTLVGVVDRLVGKRDRLRVGDYLTDHLSSGVRQTIGQRSIAEVARSLGDLAETHVDDRSLTFTGPGAQLQVAAIYH